MPGESSKTLTVIPARGGSKGLPRKNTRPLGGKPLIAHTIEAALAARAGRVIVSTDDAEIAEISQRHGAEVPFVRPAALATDTASSLSVLLHAIEHMESREGYRAGRIVFLQPTSPFRTAEQIAAALAQHAESGARSTIGVTEVQEFHPFFMFKLGEGARLSPLFEMENRPLRRQDLPPVYRINGALYITRREYYNEVNETSAIFDWNDLNAYVMDAPSSIDINDYMDFQRAELVLRGRGEAEDS